MTKTAEFYHLYSSTMDPGFRTKVDRARAYRTWQCRGCGKPLPGCGPIDVELESLQLQRPLNFVSGGFPGLVWLEFLAPLNPRIVARDLTFGRVFNEKGREAKGWATFHARMNVIIRGAVRAGSRICTDCGREVYSAQGHRFLFPSPPSGASIYGSHLAGLVVRESLFRLLDVQRWKKGIDIDELNVEEPPAE